MDGRLLVPERPLEVAASRACADRAFRHAASARVARRRPSAPALAGRSRSRSRAAKRVLRDQPRTPCLSSVKKSALRHLPDYSDEHLFAARCSCVCCGRVARRLLSPGTRARLRERVRGPDAGPAARLAGDRDWLGRPDPSPDRIGETGLRRLPLRDRPAFLQPGHGPRVHVSPLKALNYDIERNLRGAAGSARAFWSASAPGHLVSDARATGRPADWPCSWLGADENGEIQESSIPRTSPRRARPADRRDRHRRGDRRLRNHPPCARSRSPVRRPRVLQSLRTSSSMLAGRYPLPMIADPARGSVRHDGGTIRARMRPPPPHECRHGSPSSAASSASSSSRVVAASGSTRRWSTRRVRARPSCSLEHLWDPGDHPGTVCSLPGAVPF